MTETNAKPPEVDLTLARKMLACLPLADNDAGLKETAGLMERMIVGVAALRTSLAAETARADKAEQTMRNNDHKSHMAVNEIAITLQRRVDDARTRADAAVEANGVLREAAVEAFNSLLSLWAAIGDAMCSGKGIEQGYAHKVLAEVNAARDRLDAALSTPPLDTGQLARLRAVAKEANEFKRFQCGTSYDALDAALAALMPGDLQP